MFFSKEMVSAETAYRREKLRDQNKTELRAVGKLAALTVALTVVLAACGSPAGEPAIVEQPGVSPAGLDLELAFSGVGAPQPQGSRGLIASILDRQGRDVEAAFSGVAAPAAAIGSIADKQTTDLEKAFSGVVAPTPGIGAAKTWYSEPPYGHR